MTYLRKTQQNDWAPWFLGLLAFLLVHGARAQAQTQAGAESVRFSLDILPILSDHCFVCHGPDEQGRKARLRLDTREGALTGGRSGNPALLTEDIHSGELLKRIESSDPDEIMPPPDFHRPLSPNQVDLIRRWLHDGAPWGRHWAFEPPSRPSLPEIDPWDRNPIDTFIRTRMQENGLTPSPKADPATRMRRVTLDLIGLPPDPGDVEIFQQNPTDSAYETLVDRLLASPRFGERLAWEWLDAARYADSNGYQGDGERTMWPWRDWVIDAFNRNLPFDTFTRWQLAGDRLPQATQEQRLATGFLRNHMINGEGGRIPEENRVEYLFDQTETVATVWLGATFNCNRCHDHKYDPFTQEDYFSLMAFFDRTSVDGSGGNPQTPPVLAVPSESQSEQESHLLQAWHRAAEAVDALENRLEPTDGDTLPDSLQKIRRLPPRDRSPDQLDQWIAHWKERLPDYTARLITLRESRAQWDRLQRSIPRVMVMEDLATPRSTFVLNRGSYLEPDREVSAAFPVSLRPTPTAQTHNTTDSNEDGPEPETGCVPLPPDLLQEALATPLPLSTSNTDGDRPPPHATPDNPPILDRLDLANWLLQPDNPLTARVTVNRLWQMVFGTGLVRTTEDFGVQSESPSHPELLDWLALEFQENGWDIKHMLRLMVTSATYQQQSVLSADALDKDPSNRWLARAPRFRMPSWMLRDVALAAAGLLQDSIGGPPVKPYQPPGVWEEATFGNKRYVQDHGDALYKRSIYVFWRRIIAPTLFFDVANRQVCTVRTPRTNVPLHALLTLNETAYVEAARVLAQHLLAMEASDSVRMDTLFLRVLSRPPTARESSLLFEALDRHRRHFEAHPEDARHLSRVGDAPTDPELGLERVAAWTLLCTTVLNLDEALTKE